MTGGLSVRDLWAGYGSRDIVRGLSLDLEPGKLGILHGRNGCGKTTLLKVLAGRKKARSGRMDWNGSPLADRDEWFLGQELLGFEDLTVRENLEFAGQVLGLTKAEALFRSTALIRFWELEAWEHTLVRDLSTGLGRRADMAMVLVQPRPLLLLDEPLNGLDAASLDRLLGVLRSLKSRGTAILLATHVRKPFEPLADLWLEMDLGEIPGGPAAGLRQADLSGGSAGGELPWLL